MQRSILFFLVCMMSFSLLKGGNPQLVRSFNLHPSFSFQENKGQLTNEKGSAVPDILYYGEGNGANIYCFKDKIAFVFTKVSTGLSDKEGSYDSHLPFNGLKSSHKFRDLSKDSSTISVSRMEMNFKNSIPATRVIAEEQQEEYFNYYLGHCPNGITAHTYKKLTYKGIYNNIDLVLETKGAGMEYSFIVYPGGNISDIQIQWTGADSIISILDGSRIRYSSALGYLEEGNPKSFITGGEKISTHYKLQNNLVSFDVSSYNKSHILTIDPGVVWATYFSGDSSSSATSVTVGDSGYTYITGLTFGKLYFAASGFFSKYTFIAPYIAKFTSAGMPVWATYFAGDTNKSFIYTFTRPTRLCPDKSSNIYLTGGTPSRMGIATSGAYLSTLSKLVFVDAFLLKFNSAGKILWGTYFGGNSASQAYDVTTDDSNNVIIAGETYSDSNIATSGAFKTKIVYQDADAFVAKFDPTGKLKWSTYFGGSKIDCANGVATDSLCNIIIVGATQSTSSIATTGAYQTSFGGATPSSTQAYLYAGMAADAQGDGFIAKFTPAGKCTWSTYFGGSDNDEVYKVAIGTGGNIFIVGATCSSSNIASSGAFKTSFDPGSQPVLVSTICPDVFIARFSSSGSRNWSTYYGGNEIDNGTDIKLDKSSHIYISGLTRSASGIATPGAYDTAYLPFSGHYFDREFMAKFTNAGKRIWGTYFGTQGFFNQDFASIALDSPAIYLAGIVVSGLSKANIATPGAYQAKAAKEYNVNAFLAKFKEFNYDAGISSIQSPKNNTCSDSQTVRVFLKNYGTDRIDSVRIYLSVNKKTQHQYRWSGKLYPDSSKLVTLGKIFFSPGIDTIKVWTKKPNGQIDSVPQNDTAAVIDTILSVPLAITGGNLTICGGDTVYLGSAAVAGNVSYWTSKPSGFYSTISNPKVTPDVTTTYYLIERNTKTGCYRTDSAVITVYQQPSAQTGGNRSICPGSSLTIGAHGISGHSYHWSSKPKGFISDSSNPVITPAVATEYYLTETNLSTGCSKTDSAFITFYSLPAAKTGPNKIICQGKNTIIGSANVKTSVYKWTSNPKGFTSDACYSVVSPDTTTTYYLTETDTFTHCSKTDSVTVKVIPYPAFKASIFKNICIGNSTVIGDSAVAGHTYKWTSDPPGFTSTSSNPTITPTSSTVYYLTETSSSTGCSKIDTVVVKVNPFPLAKAGTNHSVCLGERIPVGDTAVNGNTYVWTSKPAGFISNKSNPVVQPAVTTTYYLTETVSTSGCSKTDSIIITVNPLPVADAGKDTFICEGESVSLGSAAQAGYTYAWTSFPAGFKSSSASITVSPIENTFYILSVQNINGCGNTDSIQVKVIPLPQPYAGQSRTICEGDSFSLGSKPIADHVYQWSSKPPGFSATIPAPVIKPTVTTTYFLKETNAYGCSETDSVTIKVNPKPMAKTSGDKTICIGDKVAIGGDSVPGNSYSWTSPSGFLSTSSNPVVSPEKKTMYILTETTPAGCNKKDSVTITVNPLPLKPFAGVDRKICIGDTATLGLTTAPGLRYNWTSDPAGFTSNDSMIRVNPDATKDYIITVISDATGCSNADTVRVTVIPLPKPAISGQKNICGIDTASYSTAKHDSSSYFWTVRKGLIVSGQNTAKVKVQWLDTASVGINVKEINANGCVKADSVEVRIHPRVYAGFIPYQSCAGNSIHFQDSLKKGLSYTWDFGDGTVLKDQLPVHAYAKAGTYRMKLSVQNAVGCQDTISHLITISPVPENVKLLVQHDTGRTYQFGVSDTSYVSYTWSFGDGDSSMEKFPVHTFSKSLPDKVKLIVDNSYHCITVLDTTLEVSYLTDKDSISIFPNPFSDRIHIFERLKENTNMKLYLYDMLGQEILDNVSWNREPGVYTESFDEYGLAQAIYIVKLVVNDKEVIYKKMIKLGR